MSFNLYGQVKLSHNTDDKLRNPYVGSCNEPEYWARAFTLSDFGITLEDEFVVNTGNIGVWWSVGGERAIMQFNIYSIGSNFPNTFLESNLIGSSQQEYFPYVPSFYPEIVTVNFVNPLVIPAGVERILVEVKKVDGPNIGYNAIQIAGTDTGNDFSWYKGCLYDNPYKKSIDFGSGGRRPAHFYINVEGEIRPIKDFPFDLENTCFADFTEFKLRDAVDSIVWDFDDPASGKDNTSTSFEPSHVFTSPGTYKVSVTATRGTYTNTETTQIEIYADLTVFPIKNIEVCEDFYSTGVSSNIDTSKIESQVLGGQTGMIVSYFDSEGNKLPSPLPNPMANSTANLETITVRVANGNNLECYAETSFNLIVNQLPEINPIGDIYSCDNDYDGFTKFDIGHVETNLVGSQPGLLVEYFYEDGQQVPSLLKTISNRIQNKETITARITNLTTNCFIETTFNLIINPLPIANTLDEIIGCDDNGDGISEYFDILNVESIILGGQTGLEVGYYDSKGRFLSNSLSNPYSNSIANEEIITVRVTNPMTSCYAETPLVLKTSIKPQINIPRDIFSCDEGNGISTFDLSFLENEIIGSQTGLNVYYFDTAGNEITNYINSSFQNTDSWLQTIHVKVENATNVLCVSETSFNLIIDELPQVDIQDTYFLCNLEPNLPLLINASFDAWEWTFEDGSLISNSNEAILTKDGDYELTVTEYKNGKTCENSFKFELVRSVLPTIVNVDYQELTDDNYIKINASGDGDFEYSIDGVNFQNSNYFDGLLGGVYNVSVRDTSGCGEDEKQVTIIDYPNYFTPNGDGVNDYWQIKGITNYLESEIYIYNRYGKLLKELSASSKGWDGVFKGVMLANGDYWFSVRLNDGRIFKGHFTLKR
ncbi:T9SS type B sorting domain-containing protein [Algibacter sp. AS12]|uniref:T9SS type B sorting domain-containing protein n=1 Tax=Algibacter sp. AS12 TaxID=3135773 RepID=UPI00398B51D7